MDSPVKLTQNEMKWESVTSHHQIEEVEMELRRRFAADDWGLSPAVNEGILRLAEKGVLNSVSCMANAPYFGHELKRLQNLNQNGLLISVHLNLSYGDSLATESPLLVIQGTRRFRPFSSILRRSYFDYQWRKQVVGPALREFDRQIRFLQSRDLSVSAIDGHHHVHMLAPFFTLACERAVVHGIHRVRIMRDRSHLPSWFQGALAQVSLRSAKIADVQLEECAYIMREDLRNKEALEKKMALHKKRALLIHPALRDDFDEFGVKDDLRSWRVEQLKLIEGFLNA